MAVAAAEALAHAAGAAATPAAAAVATSIYNKLLPCNYGNNMIIGPRITVIAPTNSPSIFAAIVNSNKLRVVLMSFFKIKNVNRE